MAGKAVIERQRRVFDDFFKIDELAVRHERADGTMSAARSSLVFERGDSIAILLFDAQRRSVILVEQFRVPVWSAAGATTSRPPTGGSSKPWRE
jgi:ADP-ribose pyrophosphatase